MTRIEQALRGKNIGCKVLAKTLGIAEKTAWNKIHGETEFSITEAQITKRDLLPEYDLDYLFPIEQSSDEATT